MSKETVFDFLTQAAKDRELKQQLNDTSTPEEVVEVAHDAGYEFSPKHVDEALSDLKQQPGFFGAIAEAALRIFSPHDDNYPATGAQPFSGELKRK